MTKTRHSILSGAVIAPFAFALAALAPTPSEAVVLTTADGVIRNSLCTGFDCPNSPVFDDSTILLMENNTRIKFGDTSNSPFPNNDWEIEANSSLSGGKSYLGINDCGTADNDGGCATDLVFAIEAGARSSALYVQSDGDIGIGTSNPVLDIHVVTGNTPALRLDQDGSSGFTSQVWDVAGNETNFFIRDVTAGSRLPLRIRPGAPTSSIDIAASGNVGIGTASPSDVLHLNRTNGAVAIRMQSGDPSAPNPIRLNFNTAQNEFRITYDGLGVNQLRLTSAGNLIIAGQITTSGSCSGGCDLVFDPDYDLPSIDQHADEMWKNRHLPAVGPTPESGPFNLSEKVGGMLNELEKAHIYIEQLNNEKKAIQSELDALRYRIATMEASLRR